MLKVQTTVGEYHDTFPTSFVSLGEAIMFCGCVQAYPFFSRIYEFFEFSSCFLPAPWRLLSLTEAVFVPLPKRETKNVVTVLILPACLHFLVYGIRSRHQDASISTPAAKRASLRRRSVSSGNVKQAMENVAPFDVFRPLDDADHREADPAGA